MPGVLFDNVVKTAFLETGPAKSATARLNGRKPHIPFPWRAEPPIHE